jgi:hypothetical protein
MKRTQVFKSLILATLTVFAMGLLFNGCSTENPVAVSTDQPVAAKNITFVSLVDVGSNSLAKVVSAQKWISKSNGGTLHMHYTATSGYPRPEVVVDLKVPAWSIDYSKTISVTFDDAAGAELVFGPHGTQYGTPALLTVECKNFNLSGIDPNSLKFYYVNESGQWIEHPVHEIFVDVNAGVLRVVDAQIPHFSRYAIGYE